MPVITERHPLYAVRMDDWALMRDSHIGERAIKARDTTYLPETDAQRAEGMNTGSDGRASYDRYKARAVYHEIVRPALQAALGVMHRKPPTIELPKQLEPFRERVTYNGESLETLLVQTNEEQLLMGRVGLLLDVQSEAPPNTLPYILKYAAETITNWDATEPFRDVDGQRNLTFVVLNETNYQRQASLTWEIVPRYKVLVKSDSMMDVWPDMKVAPGLYAAAEAVRTETVTGDQFVAPSIGGRTLLGIPFVFVGPRDLVPEPDLPPLLALARVALSIYRLEADYRQALHMQGQDTLVLIGGVQDEVPGQETKVGAEAVIRLPLNGDAKYVGAEAQGLAELAQAINADKREAENLGAQLLTERGGDAESGEALKIRVASKTATLTTVAKAGAEAVKQMLRNAAEWVGADPDKVEVHPNLDFDDSESTAQELVQLMTAKMMGAPVSKRTVHDFMVRKDFTKMTFDEEQEEIESEPPSIAPLGGGLGGRFGSPPPGQPGSEDEEDPPADEE